LVVSGIAGYDRRREHVLVIREAVEVGSSVVDPTKEFDFRDADLDRIRMVLDNWTALAVGTDSRLLEPLLNALAATSCT
jgi:hypothetical protein